MIGVIILISMALYLLWGLSLNLIVRDEGLRDSVLFNSIKLNKKRFYIHERYYEGKKSDGNELLLK